MAVAAPIWLSLLLCITSFIDTSSGQQELDSAEKLQVNLITTALNEKFEELNTKIDGLERAMNECISDDGHLLCKHLDVAKCDEEEIKEECPQLCEEPSTCKYLDAAKCDEDEIREECPLFCASKEDHLMCKHMDAAKCTQEEIKEECPQHCDPSKAANKCPSVGGFVIGSQCFVMFRDETRKWEDAQNKCRSEGLILAEPLDSLAVKLRKYVLDTYGDGDCWVGARGTGRDFKWQESQRNLWSHNNLMGGMYGSNARYTVKMVVSQDRWLDAPNKIYESRKYTGLMYTLCQVV